MMEPMDVAWGLMCTRCSEIKERVFIRAPNPSYAWSSPDGPTLETLAPPPIEPAAVCIACLTDEEVALVLLPLVMYTLQAAFAPIGPGSGELGQALAVLTAALRYRGAHGYESFHDQRNLSRALLEVRHTQLIARKAR